MITLASASLSRHSRSIELILLAHALTVCLGLGLAVTCTLHNKFVKVAILNFFPFSINNLCFRAMDTTVANKS